MFGFGKKKIDVVLESYNFTSGDTVKGKVVLTLDKPVHARQLRVELFGERISTTMQRRSDGSMHSDQEKTKVFTFKMPLDGEKDYMQGEYTFEIKIPSNILQSTQVGGVTGEIIKTIQSLSMGGGRVSWYIQADLDVPMGVDVSKKVQINIG